MRFLKNKIKEKPYVVLDKSNKKIRPYGLN
jgi:hypothetical protein